MNITKTLKPTDMPTKAQLARIKKAAIAPVMPDDDSPAYTFEQLAELYAQTRRKSVKKPVGLRLRQETIDMYKSFGKGYTGAMAAVLEYSIKHPEILKEALPQP